MNLSGFVIFYIFGALLLMTFATMLSKRKKIRRWYYRTYIYPNREKYYRRIAFYSLHGIPVFHSKKKTREYNKLRRVFEHDCFAFGIEPKIIIFTSVMMKEKSYDEAIKKYLDKTKDGTLFCEQ